MDQGLTDRNSETRDLFSPVKNLENIDQADLVATRDTKREQQINVESHETVSQPDEVFAQPFITKGFQLEFPEEHPENKENGDDENMDSRPKRATKHTAKAIESRLQTDSEKLEKIWKRAAKAISKLQSTPDSTEDIRKATSELRSIFSEYQLVWVSLMDYTALASIPEQQRDREALEDQMRTRKSLVQTAINEAIDRKNDLLQELGSARSGSRVSRSSLSSNAMRAHARGEAAAALKRAEMQKKIKEFQTKSALAMELEKKSRENEVALEKKKRKEEAHLELLRKEREKQSVVVTAHAKAIDEELGFEQDELLSHLPTEEPSNRVQEFINSQLWDVKPARDVKLEESSKLTARDSPEETVKPETPTLQKPLNPGATPFSPGQTTRISESTDRMECFIQFMARRELISNRIEKFDNRPENYTTWRAAFRNMTREVNITASEELALMIEHTTGESKRLVQRLRNAYAENPAAGVSESWKKLGERFGSTAIVTQVHLNKLVMFPTLSPKDNKGLQELGDLLLELQCAKQDGGLTGLKILDEPAFLKPLLVKLSADLQSRWQRHAYRYKSQHSVDFPPFQEFASFIQEIARERNDPYLSIETPAEESQQPRPPLKPPKVKPSKGLSLRPPSVPPAEPANGLTFRQGLTALRTELLDTAPKHSAPRDPAKQCVILKLCHPLGKCLILRSKSLAERKALLTQHGICFRCLASTNHLAKDCTAVVKCSECQSDRHMAALHTGPINKPTTQVGQQQEVHQQGEEAIQVSASCTEICGSMAGSRSCSKICLANIYTKGHPANKIKTYVVIDDQSNCSLAKAKLFDLLKLDGEAKPYTLKRCSGTSQSSRRCAHDLIIESLDGTHSYTLPVLTECDAIPDSREEISTLNVTRAFPHLNP